MKKTYQIPEVKIVKLEVAHQMLAGSPGYGGDTDALSGNLSRRNDADFWDEEEDEY